MIEGALIAGANKVELRLPAKSDKHNKEHRKLSGAPWLVPSPRYFANLLKRSQNNALTIGTRHANSVIPESAVRMVRSLLGNQSLAEARSQTSSGRVDLACNEGSLLTISVSQFLSVHGNVTGPIVGAPRGQGECSRGNSPRRVLKQRGG